LGLSNARFLSESFEKEKFVWYSYFMGKKLSSRQGQSTVEYILMVTAVLAICLELIVGFIETDDQGQITSGSLSTYQNQLNETYSTGADAMTQASQQFFSSVTNSAN
jgi:hypothetical protein